MGSLSPDALSALDPETFAEESNSVLEFLSGYYRDIDEYPVMAKLQPGSIRKLLPETAPESGVPMDRILDDVRRDILPGLTHWQSPQFFAYFPANASTAGFAGEMLSAGLNVVPFVWAASPVATELEQVVVDWMAALLGLPERFQFRGGGGGVLHGSTCEAVVCTMAAARDRALRKLGHAAILDLVVYASDQTHATFQKGASIVGIPPANFRVLRTSPEAGYGLTAAAVRAAVEDDVARGLVPLYLCATVGTTGLGAIDRVRELGQLARRHGTNLDYKDYKDRQIALSRRFRAIKLWVVLRRYGAAGMRAHIRRHVWMARWFEKAVAADERFEVVVPRSFSLVCFRLRPTIVGGEVVEAPNRELLAAVNASGRAFMTHFVVDGKFVIRLAVGGPMTQMRHVRDAWELLKDTAN
ncbi:hypothetical protein U9M48_001023, partial [Paspalum notatum var. saurae]